jgi:hypothetical protein
MRLPRSVQEIADVIGRERALYLVGKLPRCERRDKRYPGAMQSEVMLYVPTLARLTLQHDLVRILGLPDAEKLCRHFGGEILRPASCAEIYKNYRDRMIDSMLRSGMTAAQVAAVMGVSDRHVRTIQAEIPRDELPKAANDNAPIQRKARAANGKRG